MSEWKFKTVTAKQKSLHIALVVISVATLNATTANGQGCPFVGSGGPPTIDSDYYTTGGCPLYKSGMFIRKATPVDINAVGTADGQCIWMGLDHGQCVIIKTEVRNVSYIQVYQKPPNGADNSLGRVYGITDPVTRVLAYYQRLDSRDTFHSTGPLRWSSSTVGTWGFTVFTVAQTTACNIQPRESDHEIFDLNIRSALHNGDPNNGSLDGGAQVQNGTGYYHYFGADPVGSNDAWGGQEAMLAIIQAVGNGWAATYVGGMIGIGDISLPGGGSYPLHSYHQNGRDVDVRYVRNDWAWGETQGQIDVRSDPQSFNREATIDLIKRFGQAAGCHTKVYVDSQTNITANDFPGVDIEVVPDTSGTHSNHFHFQTCDPDGPDDNVCRS